MFIMKVYAQPRSADRGTGNTNTRTIRQGTTTNATGMYGVNQARQLMGAR